MRTRTSRDTAIIGTRWLGALVGVALIGAGVALGFAAPAGAAPPLAVCATVPDLGSLVRAIGGPEVSVTVFAKGTEDPHFIEPKPSFIKALNDADALVVAGFELEIGWLPPLLQAARNPAVLPGGAGHVDASTAVTPLEAPAGPVDRSQGDVHPRGNPHYLLDPVNWLLVANLLRARLGDLRPEARAAFDRGYADFRARLGTALFGAALAARYDVEKLATLAGHERLDAFLAGQGEAELLGGWLGLLRAHRGVRFVDDHNVWPYFARRYGLVAAGHMEPRPGIPPTTRHLGGLVERMRAGPVRLILASAYYDPRHARFLAEHTGAHVVDLANQVGARPGTDDYLAACDHNVRQVAAALRSTP